MTDQERIARTRRAMKLAHDDVLRLTELCGGLVAGGAAVTAVQWRRMHGRVLAALPRIYRAERAVERLAEMLDAKLQNRRR
jgi:hypothetical protein